MRLQTRRTRPNHVSIGHGAGYAGCNRRRREDRVAPGKGAFQELFDLAGFSTFAARVPSVDAGLTPLILRTLGGNYVVEEATLGSTGFEASIVGIGDLDDRSVPLEQSVATMHRAMDFGLNVIDTAPGLDEVPGRL